MRFTFRRPIRSEPSRDEIAGVRGKIEEFFSRVVYNEYKRSIADLAFDPVAQTSYFDKSTSPPTVVIDFDLSVLFQDGTKPTKEELWRVLSKYDVTDFSQNYVKKSAPKGTVFKHITSDVILFASVPSSIDWKFQSFEGKDMMPLCILRSSVGANTCITHKKYHRMLTFLKSNIQEGKIVVEDDRCLGFTGENDVTVLRADSCSAHFTNETSTLAPGNAIQFGHNECLAAESLPGGNFVPSLKPCDREDSNQRWFRDAICQLTTREAQPTFQMESVDTPGQCLAMNRAITNQQCGNEHSWSPSSAGTATCGTADATYLKYFYGQANDNDSFLLKQVNSSLCVERPLDPQNEEAGVQSGPIQWSSCSKSAFNMWELVNGTVFQSAQTDDNTAVSKMVLTYSACSGKALSLDPTVLAGDSHLARGARWRKYGIQNSAVELAIKPNALIQEITDPVLKFQLWLWNDDGRRSRMLLAKLDLFGEFSKKLASFVEEVERTVGKIGAGLGSATSFTGPLARGADKLVDFMRIVAPIIMIFERIPYVGPVLRAIKLRMIIDQAKSKVSKGKLATGAFNSTFSTSQLVVATLPVQVAAFRNVFDGLPERFNTLGRILVRLTRCAFVDGNTKLQDVLNGVTEDIIDAVDAGYGVMTSLRQVLDNLVEFWNRVESSLLAPIKAVNRSLEKVNRILDKLSFLKKLVEFRIRFKIPIIGTISFGIIDIANFLGKIERAIKRIPFVGWAWRAVETIVSSLMKAIFPKIELPLPSFDFLSALSPFDQLEDTMKGIVSRVSSRLAAATAIVDNWVANITDGVNLESVFDRIDVDLPDPGLLDACMDVNGSFEGTCMAKLALSSIPGVPMEFVDDGLDFYDRIKDKIEAKFTNTIETFVNAMGYFECKQNTTMPFPQEVLASLFKSIGINCTNTEECAALFGPNLPSEIEFCSEYGLDENEAEAAMQPLMDEIQEILLEEDASMALSSNTSNRRRLSPLTDEKIADRGLSFVVSFSVPFRAALSCTRGPSVIAAASSAFVNSIPRLKSGIEFSSEKVNAWTENAMEKLQPKLRKLLQPVRGDPIIKNEPWALAVQAKKNEVLSFNFAYTKKYIDKTGGTNRTVESNDTSISDITSTITSTIKNTFGFSIGVRWQLQLALGIKPNYISIVKPKLKEYNKIRAEFKEMCLPNNSLAFKKPCERFSHELFNIEKKIKYLRDLDVVKNVSSGAVEAIPFAELTSPEAKVKARHLAKHIGEIGSLSGSRTWEKLQSLKPPSPNPCHATLKGSFIQLRVKARGTGNPKRGIQWFYGFQTGLNVDRVGRSFTFRKDFFIKNKDPKSQLIADQDVTSIIGNNALLLFQPLLPAPASVSGHVGLGFTVFKIDKSRGEKMEASFPMFEGEDSDLLADNDVS